MSRDPNNASPAAPPSSESASATLGRKEFAVRTGIVIAMLVGAGFLSAALLKTVDVWLLLFAAMLLAIFLRGLADIVAAHSRLQPGVALTVVCLLLAGATVALVRLLAPAALAQSAELADRLPIVVAELRDQVAATTWGGDWLGITESHRAPIADPDEEVGELIDQAGSVRVIGFLSTIAEQLGTAAFAIAVIIPSAVFFAAQPSLYFNGALGFLPGDIRPRARAIAEEVVQRLGWWLIGQAVLAFLLGLITGLGLWALGVPLALILGLLRGGLNIIPNVGPIVAVVPGLIVAAGLGGGSFVQVAVLYAVIQFVDTNMLAPWVYQRTVHMAPMVLIGGQLVLGVLFGLTGVIVAAPLIVVGMVVVQRVYIEGTLGEASGAQDGAALPERRSPGSVLDRVLTIPGD